MIAKALWTIPRIFIGLKAATAHTLWNTGGMINVWTSITTYDVAYIPAYIAVEEVAVISHERLNRRKLVSTTPTATPSASSTTASAASAYRIDR